MAVKASKLRKISKGALKENITGYLFAAPWFIGFAFFVVYAVYSAFYHGFTEYSVLKATGMDRVRKLPADFYR